MLVDELNHMFNDPLVEARPGGKDGGGTSLTPIGEDVVRRYRAIEANVARDSDANISALEKMVVGTKRKTRPKVPAAEK